MYARLILYSDILHNRVCDGCLCIGSRCNSLHPASHVRHWTWLQTYLRSFDADALYGILFPKKNYQLLEHCAIMSNSTEINTNVVRKVRLSLRNFRLSLINDLGQRLKHAIIEPPEIAIQRYQERSITLFLFRRAVHGIS